jgi:NitT/TauT family transport system ATP-binding protein
MLEVTDLTYAYGQGGDRQLAVAGVSLKAATGELVSIVGPSGCGKSTVLRCIAGLLRPAGGTIMVDGTRVNGTVPEGLAVVFQDYSRSLYPWLTVLDNVALPLRRRQQRRARRTSTAQHALGSVGLNDAGRYYPWQLSGGMQQRVAIARAIAFEPMLLLMDEPFGSVDAQTRDDLEDLVLLLRRDRGMTILLVTHDIDESVYTGDRVIVMTGAPGHVRANLTGLPGLRDQITTRQLPAFVHLRSEVGRLVREERTSRYQQVPHQIPDSARHDHTEGAHLDRRDGPGRHVAATGPADPDVSGHAVEGSESD